MEQPCCAFHQLKNTERNKEIKKVIDYDKQRPQRKEMIIDNCLINKVGVRDNSPIKKVL